MINIFGIFYSKRTLLKDFLDDTQKEGCLRSLHNHYYHLAESVFAYQAGLWQGVPRLKNAVCIYSQELTHTIELFPIAELSFHPSL